MNVLEQINPKLATLLYGPPRSVPRPRPEPAPQPLRADEERSLVQRAKDAGLSAVSAVGNVLDLPGSMVRDVISLQNPFDQILTPTSSINRTSGRDLSRKFGFAGPEDTTGNAIGGFAAEVALDPLSYLTFNASALTKAGRVARNAGLMEQLPMAAASRAGRAVGSVGPREARMTTSLDELLRRGPAGSEPAQIAAGGNLDALRGDRLGGLVGVGLPFRDPSVVLGTGKTALKVARGMDAVGSAVRFGKIPGTDFAPVNTVARLFDPAIRGAETPVGQAVNREHSRGLKQVGVDVDGEVIALGKQLESAGMTDVPSGDRLRDVLEGIRPVTELPESVRPVAESMRKRLDDMLVESRRWGVDLDGLSDWKAGYFPRHIPQQGRGSADRLVLDGRDLGRIAREDWLRDIPGGTTAIKRLLADDDLGRLIDGGASTAEVERFLKTKHGGTISDTYRAIESGQEVEKAGRFEALAGFAIGLPADLRRAGGFANNPLEDYRQRLMASGRAIEGAKAMAMALGQPGVLRRSSTAGEQMVSVGELAKRVGIKLDGDLGKKIADAAGVGAGDVAPLMVPKVLGDDLAGSIRFMTEPRELTGFVNALDDLTNAWKAMVTAPWPAFHFRNVVSGQIHNALLGLFSPGSLRAAHQMMRGGVVKGSAEIPIVRVEFAKRGGGQLDDRVATEILGELVGRHGVAGGNIGEMFATTGRVTGSIDQGMPAVVRDAMAPGRKQVSARETLRKAVGRGDDVSWLPWEVRGVGGRNQSRFAPVAAGDEVGRYGEGLNRIAPFIQQLQRGVDPSEAARRVGAAQAMYGRDDVTPFVADIVSRVFPFAKFTLGTAPAIVRQVLERPGGAIGQSLRASGQTSESATANLANDRVRDGASVRLDNPLVDMMFGKLAPGSDRYLSNMGLVHEDLLSFADPGRELGGRLNPVIRGPLELLTGTAFHTGGRLQDVDPPLGRLVANAMGRDRAVEFPLAMEQAIRSSPASRAVSTAAKLADGTPESVFNVLTGLRVSNAVPSTKGRVASELVRQMGVGDEFVGRAVHKRRSDELRESARALIRAIERQRSRENSSNGGTSAK